MSELSTQLAAALPQDPGSGPEWVKGLRVSGAEQFRKFGLPTRKDETWKFTGLGLLAKGGVQLASVAEVPGTGPSHRAPLVGTGHQVTMLDGRILDQSGELPAGLTVLALDDALNSEASGLQTLLESLPDNQKVITSSQGFTALNTATLGAGMYIHVAAETDAGRLLINWSSLAGATPRLFNVRICIIVEQGAKLELLEQFESPDDNANTCNIVMQADLATGASLKHICFQQESENAVLISRTVISQQTDSEYSYYGFDLGGGLVRHDLHTSLQGKDAKSNLYGAYLLDGNRHVDNYARVDHIAPACKSDQYFRGVAGGSGRAVFNTSVCVHPGADETEARQSNANILLSDRAVINTKPELEVYADEVVASHGATVGQLDEQAVFYLRSRGLSEQEARQMLTTAFCRSVCDKLLDQELGELISQRMMDVMPQAGDRVQ